MTCQCKTGCPRCNAMRCISSVYLSRFFLSGLRLRSRSRRGDGDLCRGDGDLRRGDGDLRRRGEGERRGDGVRLHQVKSTTNKKKKKKDIKKQNV